MAVKLAPLLGYFKKAVLDEFNDAPTKLLFPYPIRFCLAVWQFQPGIMKNRPFLSAFLLGVPFSPGK